MHVVELNPAGKSGSPAVEHPVGSPPTRVEVIFSLRVREDVAFFSLRQEN